jgi:hypothetical protein
MKTTVEISDSLMRDVRRLAAREGVTMRTVIERSLRREIADAKPRKAFKLRLVSVKGEGLQPEFQGASWQRILEAAYEGRG